MFCSPSKLKENRILKNRTLSFETATKTRGNMVIVATLDRDAYLQTISGSLFRPTQLLASYVPRKIKPASRQAVVTNQKEFYAEMRAKTNGRIKRGKTLLSTYNSLNVVYDFYNSYSINTSVFVDKGYHRQRLQSACFSFFENWLQEVQDDPDYDNVYLVFPMVKPYEDAQKIFFTCTNFETIDPLPLFIQAIKMGKFDPKKYSKIKRVIFYSPKGNVMVATDIHGEEFKTNWLQIVQKIRRINSFNAGEDTLDDELETAEEIEAELTPEDKLENKKEEIKQIVFKNVAKTIKANSLNDFEAATRDERDLMVSIDDKVERFINKPENKNKTIADMVTELEQDNDIKSKAVRYVETKKASVLRTTALSKNLDTETEIISSIQDLSQDGSSNDATEFKLKYDKYMDPKIKKSRLDSIDEEYNKKQRSKDLANAISAFSESEYSPMTVSNWSKDDTSTNADEKETWHVRYKTDDGKNLSLSIDIPKVYDKRYLYLGGNKKVIKKQLTRLPIVKTKPDRVEITTNYNKITISRSNGNVSRKNQFILKKLREVQKNPAFEILYGDNRAVNSKMGYSNDFEYEELAGTISKITSGNYYLNFNRDDIAKEISLTSIPEDYINNLKTPIGFIGNEDNRKALIYIENSQIYFYNIERKASEKYKETLFEFLVEDVLHLDMKSLPSIGKNFVFTKMKFLASTYPVLAVVASQVGLTNILNRYEVKYYKRDKAERNNSKFVEVRFKDCYLYYEDIPKNTLLLNALSVMNTQEFNYSEFDADRPYTKFFMSILGDSVGIHTRNMLRINLNVVVDPITVDVLRSLKQPDNIIDMLLYSNTLLVGNQYKPLNDITNYRVRSNEIVPATLYKVIADAYVNYARHRINGKPVNLNVPRGQLIKELLQMTNINDKSTLNPAQEAEEIAQSSAKGPHGVNRSDAFTLEMRAYDESMSGVLSANATPFSGSAGITRSISYDPKINDVRGFIPYDDGSQSGPNLLSPTEMLSPFTSACADASRQAMQVA